MRAATWVRGGVLLVLLGLCTAMSLWCRGQLYDNGSVTLYLPEGRVDYSSLVASEARTAQPVPFALWRQQEGVEVTNAEFNRSKRTSLVTVFGDSTIPLPSLTMLLPDSGLACLLDRNSCYELFGDTDAIGGKLTIEDRLYTIVGVFDWPSGMMVRQGRGEQDVPCDRITLSLTDASGRTQAADDFAMRHGMSPYAVAGSGFRVDAGDYVPSRWSNFEFWGTAVPRLRQQLWMMMVLPKELPQAIPMFALLHRTIWNVLWLAIFVPLVVSIYSIIKKIKGNKVAEMK